MKIRVKKIIKDAKIPKFALKGDAGMDLYSAEDAILKPGQKISCRTGVAIKISPNYVGLIWDKGGLSHKFGIKTLGGVFDSNYTGEWLIGLINLGQKKLKIEKKQKIAQVLFQKVEIPEIKVVKKMPTTDRKGRRFGSTGKF